MSESLYKLILSMSAEEKKAFAKEARRFGNEPRYLSLYHFLQDLKTYDDAIVKQKFKTNNLSDDRAKLRQALLRSLRLMNNARTIGIQIKNHLMDAQSWFNAQLFAEARASLEEAENLASAHGDTLALLEINREFRRIVKAERNNAFEAELDQSLSATPQLLQDLYQEFECLRIGDNLLVTINRLSQERREARIQALKDEYGGILENMPTPKSARLALRWLQTKVLYAQSIGDNAQRLAYNEEIFTLWQANPQLQDQDSITYLTDLGNYISALADNEQYAQMQPLLDLLEKIPIRYPFEEATKFRKIQILKLNYCINTGNISTFTDLDKSTKRGLVKYDMPPTAQRRAYFNLAILALMAGELQKCRSYCDWFLERNHNRDQFNLILGASIIRLLAIYESDEDKVDRALRQMNKLLVDPQSASLPVELEKLLINTFRVLVRTPVKERKVVLLELVQKLGAVSVDPLGMAELIRAWVIAQTSGQSIARQWQEKAFGSTNQ